MAYFLLIAFCILTAAYGYMGWRMIIPAQLNKPWNTIAWSALVGFLVLPFFSFLLRVLGIVTPLNNLLAWVAFLSLGFFSILITILIARDLMQLIIISAQKLKVFSGVIFSGPRKTGGPWNPGRRQFLVNSLNLAILGVAGGLAGYGLYEARRLPSIVEISISIPGLPKDLESFRIVQITDIHAGLTVKRDWVQTIVNLANKLSGDIIAFTGDLADGSVERLRRDVAPIADLSARYGGYFVTGNHEYYSGAEAWVEEIKRLGLTVLLNEHRVLQCGAGRILLAGVTDYSGGRFIRSHTSNPEAAFAGAPQCDLKVLLAHQPRSLYAAAPFGFDLQISGHTHGGQFFPWNLFAALQQPYIAGLHKLDNNNTKGFNAAAGEGWIYVSRGTGYWGPPVRLAARSEITVIKLTAAESGLKCA